MHMSLCLVGAALLFGSTAAGPCRLESSAVSTASVTSTDTASSTVSGTNTATTAETTFSTDTASSFITTSTTTSEASIPTVGQTFGIKAAGSDNTVINGAVLHVVQNPDTAVYLISPPRTSGTVLPGDFFIEAGTSRLKVGDWYAYTNSPDPYSMYTGPASSIGANMAYISCVKPEFLGEALQCASEAAGPIYFSVSSTGTASGTNIMPWKVGSVHSGYNAVNLVAG
ncbi:hypothetical protein AK830_g6 [Neonectria ditissima]|uniref:Ubiquitin 3 binding protein But2 C-terminal domain-containing protein n=1 Tax=Neonectria ditissima TaxID=78410 RepID=A0A0N8H948_9HYPO|nr:hypothetical protein AK830_g6 [Neonectria ditissima]